MIRQVIRKELLENLLSLRFMLSLVLVISLFAASGFVFVNNYKQQTEDYWKKANENLSGFRNQADQLYKLAFYQQQAWIKPTSLALCSEGFSGVIPNHFKFDAFTVELPDIKGRTNFTLPDFSSIDWVFIISLVLSFMAMVFTYDRICGEKQAGTLRLMLAGSVPRYKVLIGKYFGVMLTIGIPLFIGLLVSLIIVFTSNVAVFSGLDWLKIVTIVFLSFLYLSIFVLLGMLVSSRTGRSANSMVILLLIWVALVILIPSLGRIMSDVSRKSPTQEEFRQKLIEAQERVDSRAISGKYGDRASSFYQDPDNPMNNPPGRARYENALTDARNQVIEEQHNQMLSQAFTGRKLTSISPTVLYQRASEAFAGTGINRCANLNSQIKRYQEDLKGYVHNKDQEDPDSMHLMISRNWVVKMWKTISHKPVDFDSVPKFVERDLGLGQSLQLAIWDIGLLVLFNLVFFAAAFVSFLKYDVR